MIKIEKNIPIPPKPQGKRAKYPFQSMELGDSFVVPIKDYRALCHAIAYFRRSHSSQTFTIRKDEREGQVRCWRLT